MSSFEAIAEILPNQLYLTDFENAQSSLLTLQPHLVVNAAARECEYPISLIESMKAHQPCSEIWSLDIRDNYNCDISSYFDEVADRIHKVICDEHDEEGGSKRGKVLVHCFAGKSRSATLVLAYLMKYHFHSLQSALDLVSSKREIIPNIMFVRYLLSYEERLNADEIGSDGSKRDRTVFDMKTFMCNFVLQVLCLPVEDMNVVKTVYDNCCGDYNAIIDAMLSR